MKVDIHLNKKNRSALVKLCKRLFTNHKKITISRRTVTLKRRWYSLEKTRMQVVDLVLLNIPFLINELYEENDSNPPFCYADNLGAAVEYFGVKAIGQDIIQFLQYQLDNLDMSTLLNEEYDAEPSLLKEQEEIIVEETFATKKAFSESVTYFHNVITNLISEIQYTLSSGYIDTESACNSPPIRAPGLRVA